MGKPGPKKTPTAILQARGSHKAKGRADTPQPELRIPECPARIQGVRRELWYELGALWADCIAERDTIALEMAVDTVADYLEAKQEAEGQPLVFVTDKGNEIPNPWHQAKRADWARLLKIVQEFGGSPASRAGVQVVAKAGEVVDAKKRFFKGA
jgi:P27 family predicted phage terminase small subunit